MQQEDEGDNNKNRAYPAIDKRVSESYVKASTAQLRSKLSDPYVKAFRWASDRIGKQGIVCFVTNNGFIDQKAFDGMRKHLYSDFDTILHFDLKGNARTYGERRQREGGNVFDDQIRVGVGISLFIRYEKRQGKRLQMYRVDDYMRSAAKKDLLKKFGSMGGTPLTTITPDVKNNWLTEGEEADFEDMLALSPRGPKASPSKSIFRVFSLGVYYRTRRDSVRRFVSKSSTESFDLLGRLRRTIT
jgi:predicted helicase